MKDGVQTKRRGGLSTKSAQYEKTMRDLVNCNVDGILVIGLDGRALFANPAACTLLNRPLEALLDQGIGVPLVVEDHTEIEIFQPGGTSRTVEIRIKHMEWKGQPAWLANLRDITEYKNARVRLAANEKYLNTILQTARDGFWIVSLQGRFLDVNQTYCDFSGYTREEFLQLGINDIDVEEKPQNTRERIARILKTGSEIFETRHRRKDGSIFNVEVSITYLDVDGGQFVCFSRDITWRVTAEEALHQSEEKMHSIFRVAPTGIGIVHNRTLLDVNPRVCEMTGYTKEELVGKSARMLYPSQEEFEFVGREKYRQIEKKGSGEVETHWKKKDGSIIDVLLASTPIDLADLSKGVTFTALDITERNRAEEAIRKSEAALRALINAVNESVFLMETDGTAIAVNETTAARLGTHVTSMLGHNIYGFLPPDVAEARRTHAEKVIATGKPDHFEDERYGMWVANSIYPIKDETGQVTHLAIYGNNITERKQAENALRESEDKFKYVFDNSSVAKSITGVNGTLHINQTFCEMLGYSEQELNNKNWREITHPDDIELNLNEVKLILAGEKESARFIKRYIHKNGGIVWVDVGTSLRRDKDGKPLYFMTTILDITERVQAEEALRNSEERFELAMLAVNDGIWDWNVTKNKVYFDPRYYTIAGYEPNEFPHSFDEWTNRVHPEDIERCMLEINAHLSGKTETFDIQFRFRRKDGNWMWLRGRGKAVERDESGKVARMLGTHSDITDRKRAEDTIRQRESLLNKIFDVLPIGLWLADKNGNLIRSNQAGREIWGAEPLVGQEQYGVFKARRLPSGKEIAPDDWALAHTIQQGVTILDEMLEIDCFDGKKKAILNYSAPVLDEAGKVEGAVVINLDITERKQAEEAVRQSERQMKALLTSLDDIVFEFDENGIYLNIWTADENLLVLPKTKMLGKQILEVVGSEAGTPLMDAIKRVSAGGSPESVEYQLNVIGGKRWFVARTSPILSQDQAHNTVSVLVRDITGRKLVEEQVQIQLRRLRALNEIDRAISSSMDMRLSLDILLNEVLSQLEVDAASVLLLNPTSQTLEYVAGKGYHSLAIRESRVLLGQGFAGQAGLERKTVHVPDLQSAGEAFLRKELLKDEQFVEYFGVPLIAKGLLKGVLEIFHRTPLNPDLEWVNYLETLGGQAAIAIDNAQLFEGMQRSNLELIAAYDATIEGWSQAMDLRDKETEGHTLRVTEWTVKLAKKMGINPQEITHMRRGALLHDIGKLGIPDHILNKADELDRLEWAIMRQHPTYAFNMLMSINYLRPALHIPYCHHEKWDGSGYPRGLKNMEIPLAARIFAIVDVWDALRSDRPYRKGWTNEKIREHLTAESGKHFDPEVVSTFLKIIEEED